MLHNIGQLTHTLKPHPNLENILGYLKDSNAAERYFRDQEPENYQPRNDSVAQTQINASHLSTYGMTEHPSPHNKLLLVT